MNDKTMFDVLKPFMPLWCQKVLPAVFDQSLSYYELLCKVLQKYNELVAIVNAHSEKLENHETRIVTLETVTKEIQQKLTELDEAVKQNTANIAALTERVNQHDEEIEAIQAFINALKNSTTEHLFEINTTANTIAFTVNSVLIPYQSAIDTLIKRGSQVMKGGFVGGSVSIGAFDTSSTAGRIFGYVIGLENNDLHYSTFVSNTNESDPNTGKISSWRSVELMDITDITQSEGNAEYKTISQKVITDLLKKKLANDMGITGATAGQYLNIATVDADGKPLTFGFGTPGGGGSGVDIVQTTGQSTTSVMSQKATTDAINAVETTAEVGSAAAKMMSASIVYPTTAGGTDGKFVDGSGATLTRVALLNGLIGADGKNRVFTVKKTGSSEWQRITWFKSSAGEGLYDFAWYETDGTNAKTGVDRLTMATSGLFAVSEESSMNLGGETRYGIDCTAELNESLPNKSIKSRIMTITIPVVASSQNEACTIVLAKRQLNINLKFKLGLDDPVVDHPYMISPPVFTSDDYALCVCGSFGFPINVNSPATGSNGVRSFSYWCFVSSFANNVLTLTGKLAYMGETT